MKFKNRKLKFEDGDPRSIVTLSLPADFIIYAPPLRASPITNSSTTAKSSFRSSRTHQWSKPNPGFESSMALTIFVLLTALFFMGFFSAYLRCVASGMRRSRRSSNFISNSRLQQLAAASAAALSNSNNINPSSKDDQGLDPTIIGSLPILPYNCSNYSNMIMMSTNGGGGGLISGKEEDDEVGNYKQNRVVAAVVVDDKDDCVVCLCEYEEGEMVKVIPYCGHLFHPECIDLWFMSHSSCPLCRSTQLFPPTPIPTSTPDQKNKKQQHEQEKEEDDESKSTAVLEVLRRAYSFSGISSTCSSYNNPSSMFGYNNDERLVTPTNRMLKRSSSWSL